MKGKINRNGYLQVWRGKEYKDKYCPFIKSNCGDWYVCGDWCVLFGELDYEENEIPEIKLCHKTLYFKELIDERQ
jgi:hypothetical protein